MTSTMSSTTMSAFTSSLSVMVLSIFLIYSNESLDSTMKYAMIALSIIVLASSAYAVFNADPPVEAFTNTEKDGVRAQIMNAYMAGKEIPIIMVKGPEYTAAFKAAKGTALRAMIKAEDAILADANSRRKAGQEVYVVYAPNPNPEYVLSSRDIASRQQDIAFVKSIVDSLGPKLQSAKPKFPMVHKKNPTKCVNIGQNGASYTFGECTAQSPLIGLGPDSRLWMKDGKFCADVTSNGYVVPRTCKPESPTWTVSADSKWTPSTDSGKCLGVSSGGNMVVTDCDHADSFVIDQALIKPDSSKFKEINAGNGMCVKTVPGSKTVSIGPCDKKSTFAQDNTGRMWTQDGRCLDTLVSGKTTYMSAYNCTDAPTWKLENGNLSTKQGCAGVSKNKNVYIGACAAKPTQKFS